jgi:alpha/beta superfamily hydrolase
MYFALIQKKYRPMKTKWIIFLLLGFGSTIAQSSKFISTDISISPLIDGTLIRPASSEKIPIIIIIADSGPTDRNGNQQMMENNALRFLAEGLYEKGIATYRYDTRIVKQMKKRTLNEKDIRFDDFIKDAIDIIEYFKNGGEFSKIYLLGHGQGSLVGMIAAQGRADGFISIAGAGQSIDQVIVDQLEKQAPGLKDNAMQGFDDLRVNGIAINYSPGLASIFRKDIQPFILSWMKYDPKTEIAQLNIPVLIINGDKDLQIQISEAEHLQEGQPNAEFEMIPAMNHIFKKIEGNDLENSKSYNQYNLPVMPELIETISAFINK